MTRARNSAGFTFIELVIAIVLLSIVSVSVSSRWFSADAFGASTLKEQLISQARLAQRTALANSQAAVSLVVIASGDQWRYQIFIDDGGGRVLLHDLAADADGIPIAVTTGAVQTLGTGTDLDITYDSLGNLTAIVVGGVAQVHANGINFALLNTHQLCISPLGFAHAGQCV